ncbi:hypothetical protein I550_4443 [Mycobacterium intracellulare 1956]|uniref:Uncharacterized protein n=1 Tax=Mycobacterium intracellulare 1956 TaxID=1299331 RepID=X8CJN4_MYCIT|nr:hypothetical protein I550_4443 [Mycobacterium intracellulare 1956]
MKRSGPGRNDTRSVLAARDPLSNRAFSAESCGGRAAFIAAIHSGSESAAPDSPKRHR